MSGHEELDEGTAAARALTPKAFRKLAEAADDQSLPCGVRDTARQSIFARMEILRWVSTDPAYSAEDRADMAALLRRFGD